MLRPGSVDEVSRILKLATETHTPVVPQGGNTGLVGGQVPHASGNEIVVSLSRLNRVREIDVLSNTVTVEAGMVLEALHRAVDAADRMFPLSLASQGSCQIGGNLSSNAGGTGRARLWQRARALPRRRGRAADRRGVRRSRKLKKDNTGYDLKNLFVGAEGTLGIITAAVLKIFPKPQGREVGWAGVSSPEAALALFGLATELAGSNLTAFELIGKTPLYFSLKFTQNAVPPLAGDWPWHVLIEISSGRSAEDARGLIETSCRRASRRASWATLRSPRASARPTPSGLCARTSPTRRSRKARRSSTTSRSRSPRSPNSSPAQHSRWRAFSPGARVVCFGHMGDGNLHYNISQPVGADPKTFLALYRQMNKAVHDIVRDLGGSISAEHGIGQLKRDELLATAPPVGIDLMRRVKAAFDPAGIMNPGKVL